MATEFALDSDAYSQALTSLTALISHQKTEGRSTAAVYLTINVNIKLAKSKDYRPRVIPLKHKLDKVSSRAILFISKDPANYYRKILTAKGTPTEDTFHEIISLKKLKSKSKSQKSLIKLYKENDIIVADNRVHKFLPDVLGSTFYVRKKKVPFMLQMAKPDPSVKLRRTQQNKLKDDRCDVEYVYKQVKSIVGNASFVPTTNVGDVISLKIGYTNWTVDHLVDNINSIVKYLTNEENRNVIGTAINLENLVNVNVRGEDSISLPVLARSKETVENEDDDSDFEF
ncbi:hypothetical protein CORT_0B05250 [Candida orthopsilosis Co 90-125]|uniref:Uncharacterized protein n=1 Tax=Candida orthopsilosis (strain 90-125) TaxID=1136231 RepID=H8WZN8_CANO9|nr:hypothetical protein CORT_0B05250 [Candida orthopsilosis Co 90-125]CCG22233.1 hypothetical protein CORT_0B05250 [Candida orthopsilosis Co 90-125]